MEWMFGYCLNFNHNIENWDVSNVTNMYAMFYNCTNFSKSLKNWNVSNVTNMEEMFFNIKGVNRYIPI